MYLFITRSVVSDFNRVGSYCNSYLDLSFRRIEQPIAITTEVGASLVLLSGLDLVSFVSLCGLLKTRPSESFLPIQAFGVSGSAGGGEVRRLTWA